MILDSIVYYCFSIYWDSLKDNIVRLLVVKKMNGPINMLEPEEKKIWEDIKAGNIKYVEVVEYPDSRYESRNDDGIVDFSICIPTKTYRLSLNDIIEQHSNCKILIYPPSKEFPYWLESTSVYDPNPFISLNKMCRFTRFGIVHLTESQLRYEDRLFESRQNKKKELYEKDKEYESIFIDNFDYRRNRLLLLLTI